MQMNLNAKELLLKALGIKMASLNEKVEDFKNLPYATEHIKNWDILFENMPFIADFLEERGKTLRSIIDEYNIDTYGNLENTMAQEFIDSLLQELADELGEEIA